MDFPVDQVDELKELAGGVRLYNEGGTPLLLLSELRLPAGCTPTEIDALLCPVGRDGYTSRLFFADRVQTSKTQPNWNGGPIRLIERSWVAYSWNPNMADMRLAQMVVNHLKGLG